MNTSYDKFIRTTDDYHVETVQKIFKKLYDQGDIYLDSYEDWYCTPCESFWTETQLVDGKCPDCGREVHKQHEEAYFFKMSKYADRLMKYIEENPDFIQPEARKKEMINNFLKPGLQDYMRIENKNRLGYSRSNQERVTPFMYGLTPSQTI